MARDRPHVGLRRGLLAGATAFVLILSPPGQRIVAFAAAANTTDQSHDTVSAHARVADFGAIVPGPDARHLADWIAHSRDNAGAHFVIVDKKLATVFVFDAQARLRGSSPVLLGSAIGDHTVPGIGSRPMAQVLPHERTTPAGRFVGERGRNIQGEDIVWVDYDAAVSMHRVRTGNAAERRGERLATPSIADNRISYGCINVPVPFYNAHIQPAFALSRGVVYVLPEIKSVREVFGSYDEHSSLPPAAIPRPH
jgi:hypothetical protein